MNRHQKPSEIEREIEAERSALARSLEDLQSQFTPERIVDTIADTLKSNGGDLADTVSRTVRENPLAVAVTGIGLAWLAAGMRRSAHDSVTPAPEYRQPLRDASRMTPHYTTPAADAGYASDWPQGSEEEDSRLARLKAEAASALESGAERVRSTAADLRERLSHGTESMSQEARERVLNARRAAIDAQEEVERRARALRARSRGTLEEHPLALGVAAFAAGAAIGAMLPRTAREDHTLGSLRDRLLDEAERVYREESRKLGAVASAVAEEGRDIARETLEGARSAVPAGREAVDEAARDTAQRLKTAARREAKKQKLGSSL